MLQENMTEENILAEVIYFQGEHTNTAFGLSFAWDYANTLHHDKQGQ